jgi:mono/diheme cytochrome c family protein
VKRRTRPATVVALVCAIVAGQEAARRVLVASTHLQPPARLSETGLYEGGRVGAIARENRPFSPQYPLWSDGAAKQRWIYLPPGSAIDASNVHAWDFPVGTRLWKEFAFEGRKVETRFLWKVSGSRWVFASYAWNDAGTDAALVPEDGLPDVATVGRGRQHSIPSVVECRACHDARRTEVLGFSALQLSDDRDPHAIHGEPLAPGMVTLRTLVEEGLLTPRRTELVAQPPRIDAEPATRALLGYLGANCGHCHNPDTDIAQLGPSLRHGDVMNDPRQAVARLLSQRTQWQVPGVEEGASVLLDRARPDRSALLVRMRSRRPSSQMPPVGTVLPDTAALDALSHWLATPAHSR